MKRTVTVVVLVILLTIMPAYAFSVSSDGASVTIPVDSGWYDIYASGVFGFGGTEYPWAIADTEWVHVVDVWVENCETWQDNLCDLSVNGSFWDWKGLLPDGTYVEHTFSDIHKYKLTVYAENELKFSIYDSYYNDNVGGLEVTISPVPEPSSFVALIGAITMLLGIPKKRR